ncbi:MAG: TRAP transporter substrate-binding protein DctP, partial [bacterium]
AWRVIRGYWDRFQEKVQAKGFYLVGLDIRDYWGILYKKPISSLADLRNAKFRSVNAELWVEMTKLYGAIPNPVPYADVYMAFKTGVSVGSLTSVTGLTAANWHEVMKCFLDTRLVLSESFMVTSDEWLHSLPEDLRELFITVSRESEEFNMKAVLEQYQEAKETMIREGVVFVENDQIDMRELEEKVPAFREEFMKSKGPEVYRFYRDWIQYVEQTTGRPLGSAPAQEN